MPDFSRYEAEVIKEWSWAMTIVREHPKTATAISLVIGFLIGHFA